MLWGVVTLLALTVAPVALLAVAGAVPRLPTALRRRPRSRGPAPPRTLEEVSADVRRIRARYHQDGMRFAQLEGRRRSYDRVLAQAATMLEVEHLLTVLAPGEELDAERGRVERVLAGFGVLRTLDQ